MNEKYKFIDTTFVRRIRRSGRFVVTDGTKEYDYFWGSTIGLNEHTELIPGETKIRLCLLKENDKIVSAKI